MVRQKIICLLVTFVVAASASITHLPQPKGRKLFGGYRIAPKICQPTNPSRIKSKIPAVCMFNYECSRRRGEVVGACMDGFLFGACCQLPDDAMPTSDSSLEGVEPMDNLDHEIDHVPDIPILLNPDGTPIGSSSTTSSVSIKGQNKDSYENAEKPQIPNLAQLEDKFPSLLGPEYVLDDLKLPTLITHSDSDNDIREQQLQQQHHSTSAGPSPVTTLLSPNQILQVADPVDQLPALFSHGLHSKNNLTGIGSTTVSDVAETILLNENGTAALPQDSHDPDELFRPSLSQTTLQQRTTSPEPKRATTRISSSSSSTTYQDKKSTVPMSYEEKSASSIGSTKKVTSPMAQSSVKDATVSKSTTPMTLTTRNKDDLIRVPTINHAGQSNIKKPEEEDKEEIAINHIISILNDTTKATTKHNHVTNGPTTYGPTTYSYGPTLVKITTAPISGSSVISTSSGSSSSSSGITESLSSSPNYYHYNTDSGPAHSSSSSSNYATASSPSSFPTQAVNYQGSGGSSHRPAGSYSSSRPTANPPAPTVIVLGPLGTEYTTVPTQHPATSSLSNPYFRPVATKKPAATLTHNISTVINGNKQVLSVSYISVDLKDGTTAKPATRPSTIYTTLTSWSEKPNFHLRPSTSSPGYIKWPNQQQNNQQQQQKPSNCEDENTNSPPGDDVINNFPPVRHPELEQQEKPGLEQEIISADEIPTPDFVEDAELNNKVDVFVNKIVESLKDNFQNLKDVVYNPKNSSTATAATIVTKRPPTKRPSTVSKPPTKRPASTTLAGGRPKPTVSRKPAVTQATTKRPKPIRKTPTPGPATSSSIITTELLSSDATKPAAQPTPAEPATTAFPEITPNADFRSICGIRPLVKTGRIVGGKGASFGEWPWQVLVREATWLGLFTKNKCGGVLITDKFVITAAHCQPGFLASLVAVFGEFDISGELESKRSVTRNVRRVIVNRAYDPATFENDLALLELETPIQFDSHIVPICMPDDNTEYVNRMATVTGWGRLKYNGGVPSVLQEVKVPIMENSVCQEMFQTAGHSKLILESFMCAGYANGQKDSCEGDSGGPLTLQRPDGRWILVGTVSHGIKCAAPYLPGVYMRTTYFKPWLHSITGV